MSSTLNPLFEGVQRDLGPAGGHLGAVAPNALFPKKRPKSSKKSTKRQNERPPASLEIELRPFRKQLTKCTLRSQLRLEIADF